MDRPYIIDTVTVADFAGSTCTENIGRPSLLPVDRSMPLHERTIALWTESKTAHFPRFDSRSHHRCEPAAIAALDLRCC